MKNENIEQYKTRAASLCNGMDEAVRRSIVVRAARSNAQAIAANDLLTHGWVLWGRDDGLMDRIDEMLHAHGLELVKVYVVEAR